MKLYVGVTDTSWFNYLRNLKPTEVNFWQPGGTQGFKILPQGGLFLFKLKAPVNAISGLGFFASHTRLPLSVAWEIFGRNNGVDSHLALQDKIFSYRRDSDPNPVIGCIVLTDPIFFREEDYIPVPEDWGKSIVQGKSYDTQTPVGARLWSQIQYSLYRNKWMERTPEIKDQLVKEYAEPEYREILSRVRIGQGVFRTMITDAYQRRCSISGEKTLPVLEAAHIKPYAQSGPHAVQNGLLLRSDLHKLFDSGYLTITTDAFVEVSDRIRTEFENGKEYYRFRGQKLLILPELTHQRPDPAFIEWHNQHIFRG